MSMMAMQMWCMVFLPLLSQFDEIPEVLARYSTLRTTLDGLMEHEQHNQDTIDQEKADLVKFMEVSGHLTP